MLSSLLVLLVHQVDSSFHVGAEMWDTDGNIIRAHNPHILQYDERYYWFGLDQIGESAGKKGVINCYSSNDLYTWTFEGPAFIAPRGWAFRPSILGKNKKGEFVMWVHGGTGFQSAVSKNVTGPYTASPDPKGFRPTIHSKAGDSAAFQLHGKIAPHIVYSQHLPTRALKILPLDQEDWTKPMKNSHPYPTIEGHLEAPVPFFSAVTDSVYIWCSHTSGWRPNPAELLKADSMSPDATWKNCGNPSGNRTTDGTQGSHILPLGIYGPKGEERFLYMGDRFEPYISTSEGSRYIFLPLEIHPDGRVVLRDPHGSWSIENWPESEDVRYSWTDCLEMLL